MRSILHMTAVSLAAGRARVAASMNAEEFDDKTTRRSRYALGLLTLKSIRKPFAPSCPRFR